MPNPIVTSTTWALSCLTLNLDEKAICANKSLHVSKKNPLRSITNPNCFDTCCVCTCSARTRDTYRSHSCRKWKKIPWWVWIKLSIGNHLKQIKVDIKFDEVTAQLTHLTSLNDLWAILPFFFVLLCSHHPLPLTSRHDARKELVIVKPTGGWGKYPLVRMFNAEDVINWNLMFYHVLRKCVLIEKRFFLRISLN